MKLILVRHGHPDPASATPRDPSLSETGIGQARAVSTALAAHGRIDYLVSSPLQRAHETALEIANATSLPVHLMDGLAEADRYADSYRSVEHLRSLPRSEWDAFLQDPITYLGADPEVFRREVIGAFASILSSNAETAIVVTHGLPINLMLSNALGLSRITHFVPNYCSITVLKGEDVDNLTVISVNETLHLPKGDA